MALTTILEICSSNIPRIFLNGHIFRNNFYKLQDQDAVYSILKGFGISRNTDGVIAFSAVLVWWVLVYFPQSKPRGRLPLCLGFGLFARCARVFRKPRALKYQRPHAPQQTALGFAPSLSLIPPSFFLSSSPSTDQLPAMAVGPRMD